jgi:hypothetical protein
MFFFFSKCKNVQRSKENKAVKPVNSKYKYIRKGNRLSNKTFTSRLSKKSHANQKRNKLVLVKRGT